MRDFLKSTFLLSLVIFMVSCNSFGYPPRTRPTEAMETALFEARTAIAGTQAAIPTVAFTSTPTQMPTASPKPNFPIVIGGTLVSPEQEARLVEALQSTDCELPCYLGITPGRTSWISAQQILADLGAEYEGEYYESGTGMPGYGYKILVNDSISNDAGSTINPRYRLDIIQALEFLVRDSTVQKIIASADSLTQELKFRDYWSRYSPQQTFIHLGKPDVIYYSPKGGNSMTLVYEAKGILMEFDGMREGDTVCPNFELDGYASRSFTLINLNSDVSLYPPADRIQFTNREFWLPVSDFLGMSEYDLYKEIIANPSTCFGIKHNE